MAEIDGWRRDAEERSREAQDSARLAEERRLDAERRCFQAERRRLDAERRVALLERTLHEMGLANARMRGLVSELGGVAARLRRALERGDERGDAPLAAAPSSAPGADVTQSAPIVEPDHRAEMADALAAAVERLRARVAIEEEPASSAEPAMTEPVASELRPGQSLPLQPFLPDEGRSAEPVSTSVEPRPPHKHSMSWLARWRMKRRRRRQG